MPVKAVPMDSERPKTPSWAFSAPHLAKNSKSYGFCHFSPSSSVTGSPFCTCGKVNLAPERFRVHKPSTRASRKMRQNVEPLPGIKPPRTEVLGAWGPYGHVPRIKRATLPG
jgi:hypothetical protein